jgi:hypothetical protein
MSCKEFIVLRHEITVFLTTRMRTYRILTVWLRQLKTLKAYTRSQLRSWRASRYDHHCQKTRKGHRTDDAGSLIRT